MQHAIIRHKGNTFIGIVIDLEFYCFVEGSSKKLLHIEELAPLLTYGEVESISKERFIELSEKHMNS